MTRRAVVSYAVGATDDEKIIALKKGLEECAGELIELGLSLLDIEQALEDAGGFAEICQWEKEKHA